jgi:Acetyltransferase (GNAT) domain
MPGTDCAEVAVESFDHLELLAPDALSLLDSAGDLFAGRAWWETVVAHALPDEMRAAFMVCRSASRVLAITPMVYPGSVHPRGGHSAGERSGRRGGYASLTTPYTCRYTPLLAPDLDAAAQTAAMRALSRFCRPAGVTRLDAIPAEWPALPALALGARQAGLRALRFDHFGNWFEDVSGLDWARYLATRPGALRETIRRRLRRAEALPGARFHLLSSPGEMDTATQAFEEVYARSWKQPEPFPKFNAALMRAMAPLGALRFGLWSIGDTPVAVQIWVVNRGRATVLKLAHDDAFKAHSPGTVLTASMLRHLLDAEHVVELDFGRGDDDYKKTWVGQRRQRIGMLLIDPLQVAGAAAWMQHTAGRLRMAALSTIGRPGIGPPGIGRHGVRRLI